MIIAFDIPTIIGLLITIACVSIVMFALNMIERKMDVKLSALEQAERKRVAAERASKRRGGAPTNASNSVNPILAAAAVVAVEQFRKGNA